MDNDHKCLSVLQDLLLLDLHLHHRVLVDHLCHLDRVDHVALVVRDYHLVQENLAHLVVLVGLVVLVVLVVQVPKISIFTEK